MVEIEKIVVKLIYGSCDLAHAPTTSRFVPLQMTLFETPQTSFKMNSRMTEN